MSEMPAMSDTTTNTLPAPANDDPWSAASTPTETATPAADPWGASDASLAQAIAALRAQGETVVCVLPGHESEVDEFHCDRELVLRAGQWVVQAF